MNTLSAAIAWRFLKSKKSHSAVATISAVSVCGMAVATAAIICVLSVFNGFRATISGRLSSMQPDVILVPAEGKVFANADSVASRAAKVKGVALATATLTDNALAICNSREMPVTLKGVDPEAFGKVTGIRQVIDTATGRYIREPREAAVAIGTASQLGAIPERDLMLFTPKRTGGVNMANPAASFISDSVAVTGVYRADQQEYDENGVITDIATARALLQYDTEASAIEISAKKGTDPAQLAERLAKEFGPGFIAKDRLRQQEMNFIMISIEKWVSFLLLFFILVIASFNVISSLSMLVLEKDKALGTLSALGMPKRKIGSVFFWESIYVGLIGGIAGILLGVVLCLLQQQFGFITIAAGADAIVRAYPVELHLSDVFVTLLPVAAVTLAAAAITSRFARQRIAR